MKNLMLIILAMAFTFSLPAQEIAGDWHGVLDIQGMKLRLVFHIQQSEGVYTATVDSPDQNAFGLPVKEVSYTQPQLIIRMPNLLAEYKGNFDPAKNEIEGTFTQGSASLPLKLQGKAIEKQVVRRPQNPEGPLPYYTEEVRYDNPAAGTSLAGTLSLPKKEGKFPVVIMISGSGPQNRDEELLGHKPFLVIADHLTRHGIGVLRFDDRGVGKSTGNFATATSEDFASDVLAGIAYLKTRPETNAKQIGLVGHSEGGLIAPMVASRSKDVAFIVLLAGPGVPGDEIILKQSDLIGRAEGQDEKATEANLNLLRKAFKMIREGKDAAQVKEALLPEMKELLLSLKEATPETVDKVADAQVSSITSPWFSYFLSYDPRTSLEKTKCPVLALNGEKDLQVDPMQNIPPIEAALKKAKNKEYTVKILPGMNHLFQTTTTGKPSEYGTIEETFSPVALKEISDWILKTLK